MACCSVAAAESACTATGLIFAGATSFPAFKHSNTGTRLAGKLARNSKGNNTRRSIVDGGWLRYVCCRFLCTNSSRTQPKPQCPTSDATLNFYTHTPKSLETLQNPSSTPPADHFTQSVLPLSHRWTRVLKLERLEITPDCLVNFSCRLLGALLQMPRIMPSF